MHPNSRLRVAFFILPLAAVVHVIEEWLGGFVAQMSRLVPGVTLTHFWVINAVFIAFCGAASITCRSHPVLALSAMALIGVNAFIHLAGALLLQGYSPGLLSAWLLYVPLASWTFRTALAEGQVSRAQALHAAGLGVAFMTVPLLFQGLRLLLQG